MTKKFKIYLLKIFIVFFYLTPVNAEFDIKARTAILQDYYSGEILYEKDPDQSIYPASMTKIMTSIIAFEMLRSGDIDLSDKFMVSENAWRLSQAGFSSMFIMVGDEVSVENLLKGIIVASGNDACIVVAEALGGTEENFAQMMTERAHELGLDSASFANATGWPDPDHRISALDLARLARHIIQSYPQYYDIYSETEFTYNGIRQYNRNPLIGVFDGADGLKTGHTEESGYGLVASAERDGVRRFAKLE